MDTQQVIKQLKQILKPTQILIDPEDLYVYSFERIFERQNSTPDIVVRALSSENIRETLELSRRGGFTLTKRSAMMRHQNSRKPLVLLDDVPAPELKKPQSKRREVTQILKEVRRRGHGTHRNLALALKALFLQKNLDKCKTCETCSGYCTVASSYEGVETWSSKGRILTINGLQNKNLPLSKKVVDILYTCTECGLCFAQCFEDLEVNEAILATRHQITERGLAPQVFYQTANNIIETGDPGAVSIERRLSWLSDKSLQTLPGKAEVLYWVGCMVADRTPDTAKAFLRILDHADVDFTMLGEREGCCGYILLSTGLWIEAKKVAEKALARIAETGVKSLVTPCAGCYYTFKKLYPETLGVSVPCEILHSSHFIERLMQNREISLKGLDLSVSYHDPCSLGRHSGVFTAPRNVLKSIPDLTLTEMPLNRKLGRCCGGGGGLWSFNHHVSMNSAYLRLRDLQRIEVDALTTACPLCQMNFRYTSARRSIPTKLYDITEIVESALRQ